MIFEGSYDMMYPTFGIIQIGLRFRTSTNKIGEGENVVPWQMHERTVTSDVPEH